MREAAKVLSLDVVREVKAAFISFSEDGKAALTETLVDAQRTISWLEHDQANYWKIEVRKRDQKVQQAKSDLYRAELASRDERPSCVIERKNLAKAQASLEEAQQKVQAVRRWRQLLDREIMLYKGGTQQIAGAVEVEIPQAVGRLERIMESLSGYLAVQAEAPGLARSTDGGPTKADAADDREPRDKEGA